MDDKMLVRQILGGNRHAFIQLIQHYQKLVLHIVTPLLTNTIDREDVCQDIFIKVYEKLHTFRFESSLGTWIGNIAYNTCLNFLRKNRKFIIEELNSRGDDDKPEGEATAEELMIHAENASRLTSAVNGLGYAQRTVVLLFYYDELSLAEIGEVLEVPVNTVKSHLQRARKNLKEMLST